MRTGKFSIVLLVRSLEAGGAERQLAELARGLHQRGHKVSVAVFYRKGSLLEDLGRAGIPVIDLRKRGRWHLAGFLIRTVLTLRRTRPDILYSFLGGANIVAAAVRLFVPQMRIVWSVRSSNMDLSQYDWLHGVSYSLECQLSRTADLIIANSQTGRAYAVDHGFPPDRIQIVPNGIDTERFKPDRDLREKQRAKWGLTENQIAIGVLARLDPMKGHKTFLFAASKLSEPNAHMRFFVIGAGPDETSLKEYAAQLSLASRLSFTGPIDSPEAALNALDICCSPSVSEGFSNSIAEAMACGVPCVVTDVGDSASIVGATGSVIPPCDSEALAEAICSLAARLDPDRKDLARRRIVDLYSLGRMIDRTIGALSKVA